MTMGEFDTVEYVQLLCCGFCLFTLSVYSKTSGMEDGVLEPIPMFSMCYSAHRSPCEYTLIVEVFVIPAHQTSNF